MGKSDGNDDLSGEREINLSKYLDSRAQELEYFQRMLRKKETDVTKTPMQRVPKHMRRRAMAHNRYRIPSRIRAISVKKAGVSEIRKLKCRKHLRNTKLLMLHYFKRSSKMNEKSTGKWLETHLWHSKRMKMEEYYGYKIPMKSFTKSLKPAYKLSKFKIVLHDRSYFRSILVPYGDVNEAMGKLKKYLGTVKMGERGI